MPSFLPTKNKLLPKVQKQKKTVHINRTYQKVIRGMAELPHQNYRETDENVADNGADDHQRQQNGKHNANI